jgi:predicted nucleic acid-binding protein
VAASTDVSDDLIFATAIAGNATHLVTGDKADLLGLKQIESVSIITVREAISMLEI